jgi:predicted nuclease with RNAse H fold
MLIKRTNFSGSILGYDPGGNSSHGVAVAKFNDGTLINIEIQTLSTAESVIEYAETIQDLKIIGVDTLTLWSTGKSGWRPADRWLKLKYKEITHSISSANSLFSSMSLNGMSVLVSLRAKFPELEITETHPKVLFYELSKTKYDYVTNSKAMDELLGELLNSPIATKNDHEWDAIISVYAAFMAQTGHWTNNLHSLPTDSNERLIRVCSESSYWWPTT